jgi:hypothetical protein
MGHPRLSRSLFIVGIRRQQTGDQVCPHFIVRIRRPSECSGIPSKYRNKIGLDIAVEALRRFRELKKKADFRELVRYARICRVERIIRPYLEATL